jgi:alpha-L-rhamnosidase
MHMKKFGCTFSLLFVFLLAAAQVRVQRLTTENLINPTGIGNAQPRFSWQLQSDKRGVLQTAYEIRVGSSPSMQTAKDPIWLSGKTVSDSSVWVSYKGRPLQSGKKYYWQVRVWDNQGSAAAWSAPASFQMGLLQPSDWKAKWITPGYTEDSVLRPSPLFRREFRSAKKIQSATAYITAHGMYEAQINGKRVGDAFLAPGWTSYNKRLPYQAYDVTGLLQPGNNAIAVTLGSGWYRGNLAWGGTKNIYGRDIALLLQLQLEYTDGSSETIVSDGSWKSSTGSIRYSEIYHGETIDARHEKTGWMMPGYNDHEWHPARVADFPIHHLVATENEPVKKHETFSPLKIFTTPNGEQVIDFGQNLVGWVMVKATGNAGDTIRINHAEVLDRHGNFYTENLRAAKAEANYVLKGGGTETFEPHFTFFGFRYIKISGYPGAIRPENFTAVALYSGMRETGTFQTSNPLINQLQHNIQWGQKGNFLDVPTDCPQRDERLGWTGDAQAFSRTATFNMDVHNFFSKWLKDVTADQQPGGSVPFVVPNVLGAGAGASAGWADAATIIPWNMYLAYGDKKILEEQYPGMKAWVGYMEQNSTNHLWNKGFHFGDWLFYRPFDDNDGRAAVTDKYLIAQTFFAHSTQLLINTARVLGLTEDADRYTALLRNIKEAFIREYMTPTGRLVSGTQTAYVLALHFDMLPDSLRAQAAQRLVENIRSYNNHLTTGFLGTPYLCHVLSRFGYTDVAYQLLLQESFPSWLYPVKMGATTIWERWNGIRPDSTFEPASMNSFNHYAYGAIGDWMYRVMAGLDTDDSAPGYKRLRIQPHPGANITAATATYQTPYGTARAAWRVEQGKLLTEVEVPANSTALILFPADAVASLTEGGKQLTASRALQVAGSENGHVLIHVGSGKYQFSHDWKAPEEKKDLTRAGGN